MRCHGNIKTSAQDGSDPNRDLSASDGQLCETVPWGSNFKTAFARGSKVEAS